jgi:hypothetical protein
MEERVFYIDWGDSFLEVGDDLRETEDLERSEYVYTPLDVIAVGMGNMDTGISMIREALKEKNVDSTEAFFKFQIRPFDFELQIQTPRDETTIIH